MVYTIYTYYKIQLKIFARIPVFSFLGGYGSRDKRYVRPCTLAKISTLNCLNIQAFVNQKYVLLHLLTTQYNVIKF